MNKPLPHLPLTMLLLAHTALAMAADAPQTNTSGGITEISVERTWCNGSCPIDTLVLRADGKAEYTGQENTRLTGQFTGMSSKGGFDQLARWLVAEGFFELVSSYGMPNGDNPTEVIRVTRGGERKSVINNARDMSLKLWGAGNIVRAIAADIQWQPVGAGIRGQSSVGLIYIDPDNQGFTPSGTRQRFEMRTGREGQFEIPLPAGTYRISSMVTETSGGKPQTVIVAPNRFTEVDLRYDAAVSNGPKNNASSPAIDPPPPSGDGLYIHAGSTPAKWLFRKEDTTFLLGDKTEPTILANHLESDSLDNSTFQLTLTVPYDGTITRSARILIVDGTAYRQTGTGRPSTGTSTLYFQIPDEERAREIAKYFGIAILHFTKPDYKYSVSMVPTKQSFKRGEPISARLRIVSTGTKDIEFNDGLIRNWRDEYTFSALRNGQPVADISFPGERGGIAMPYTVWPGKPFEDTVNLSKWFEFKEAGSYRIHATYKLNLYDSRIGVRIEDPNIMRPRVSWTEIAEVDFVVSIE